MNKLFFKLETDLDIKSILMFLNISEKLFLKYNKNNINLLDFKINQFSSLSSSLEDSLIFVNKTVFKDLQNIKGVCLIKMPFKEYNFDNKLVIPSENPKLDFCNLIDRFCTKKIKTKIKNINNSLISVSSVIGSNFTIGNFSKIEADVKLE